MRIFLADNPPLIGVYANAFPLADDKYEGANATLHQLRQDITPDAYADYAERWAPQGQGSLVAVVEFHRFTSNA